MSVTRRKEILVKIPQDDHVKFSFVDQKIFAYRSVPEPPRSQSSQCNCDVLAKTEKTATLGLRAHQLRELPNVR